MKIFRLILSLTLVWIGAGAAANAQITSASQLRDVKKSDVFFPALKNLIERHKAFDPYSDIILFAPISRSRAANSPHSFISDYRKN